MGMLDYSKPKHDKSDPECEQARLLRFIRLAIVIIVLVAVFAVVWNIFFASAWDL